MVAARSAALWRRQDRLLAQAGECQSRAIQHRVGVLWEDRRVPDEDDLERRLRKLAIEHAETRWLALRLDDDVKEIRDAQREHTERFDALDRHLQEHTGRFDSLEASMRSLTQMIGQVLERLPEEPRD
jgi:Fe2+ transport system protein B